jgi:uncharacterized repeat protein (TIGR04076 family)
LQTESSLHEKALIATAINRGAQTRKPLMLIKIEVVRVQEACDHGYKVGDSFIYDNGRFIPQNNDIDHVCVFACGTLVHNLFFKLNIQNPIYLSCLDAGYGKGNANVIFKISGGW